MKFARISFPTRELAVRAYAELVQRGRIVSLRGGYFIVPEPAIAFLTEHGLEYQVHEWLSSDHVTQALRNTPAHSV